MFLRPLGSVILLVELVCVELACLGAPSFARAASADDYTFPIGRIDRQIGCVAGQPGSTAADGNEEPACLARFRGVVTRSDDDLVFKLDNGKSKKVRSNTKACRQIPVGACLRYELVGYIPASRQFVLRKSAYESSAVTLVSRRTGVVSELEGFPHLSPSGAQFVTVAASDAWDIKNPIAVYADTDPPNLTWRFPEPREYEQYSFDAWDGEDRVKVHTISNPQIDTDLSRAADGWTLRRPNGKVSHGIASEPMSPNAR